MSSSLPLLLIVTLSLTSLINSTHSAPSESAEFEIGWHVPDHNDTSFYTRLADDTRFHVGDSLSFVYHNDSVMVVDKYAYYHCNTSKPIYIFRDEAKTLIKLDRPGPFYFISGAPEHCRDGQRLEVDVMSSANAHAPAPSSAESISTIPAVVLAFAATALASLAFHSSLLHF